LRHRPRHRRYRSGCYNFHYWSFSRACPSGAVGGQPRQGSEHGRGSTRGRAGTSGRPAAGAEAVGALAAGRRQPGPLPLARERTGAGRYRNAVSAEPAHRRSPPSRISSGPPARASRAVLPRRASLTPRKDHNQGRTSSLRCGRSTLIVIFHGENRRQSGGRTRLGSANLVIDLRPKARETKCSPTVGPDNSMPESLYCSPIRGGCRTTAPSLEWPRRT
jgi:hypothetical protein